MQTTCLLPLHLCSFDTNFRNILIFILSTHPSHRHLTVWKFERHTFFYFHPFRSSSSCLRNSDITQHPLIAITYRTGAKHRNGQTKRHIHPPFRVSVPINNNNTTSTNKHHPNHCPPTDSIQHKKVITFFGLPRLPLLLPLRNWLRL